MIRSFDRGGKPFARRPPGIFSISPRSFAARMRSNHRRRPSIAERVCSDAAVRREDDRRRCHEGDTEGYLAAQACDRNHQNTSGRYIDERPSLLATN